MTKKLITQETEEQIESVFNKYMVDKVDATVKLSADKVISKLFSDDENLRELISKDVKKISKNNIEILRNQIFGEEYFDDTDDRESIVNLLDSLSTDANDIYSQNEDNQKVISDLFLSTNKKHEENYDKIVNVINCESKKIIDDNNQIKETINTQVRKHINEQTKKIDKLVEQSEVNKQNMIDRISESISSDANAIQGVIKSESDKIISNQNTFSNEIIELSKANKETLINKIDTNLSQNKESFESSVTSTQEKVISYLEKENALIKKLLYVIITVAGVELAGIIAVIIVLIAG